MNQQAGGPSVLAGRGVRADFDAAGRLADLREPDGRNMLGAPCQLWTLALETEAGRREVRPSDAGAFSAERAGDRVTLTWDGFAAPEAPHLQVVVRAEVGGEGNAIVWRVAARGLGALRLTEVRFPEIEGVVTHGDESLSVPVWLGLVTDRPMEMLGPGRRLRYDYPGLTAMQYVAWLRADGPGLMLACDDTRAFRKSFLIDGGEGGRVSFRVEHLPERSEHAQDAYEPLYAVETRLPRGDWFTAAEIYRASAPARYWSERSRMRNDLVPGWVRQTGLWVWNRGRSPGVLEPAALLQEETALPVSVLWHWWHGCSYDEGFPEYLPPREGEDGFRSAVERAHRVGLHALVYMNQRLWGMETASWAETGAERYAVKNREGKVTPEVYNTFTRAACAAMCIHTDFWRETYTGIATEAINALGVDGVYMDQACSSLACYDPTHGHPVGGGAYWVEGFRKLAAGIRRLAAKPVALAGEGTGEAWLPHLDVMLSLEISRERYMGPDLWEPVPLFQAVYHPDAIQYGNYSSLALPPYDEFWPAEHAPEDPGALMDRKYATQFRLEQARSFVWGQQPAIANFAPEQLTEREEEIAYVARLARLRMSVGRYLIHGTMLRPPALAVEERTVPFSRLSIYAGRDGRLTEYERTAPLAVAAAWRAPSGRLGVALAGIVEEELEVGVTLDAVQHGLRGPATVWRLDGTRSERVGSVSPERPGLTVALAPAEACVLEYVEG